uniref:NADH dehydrogenase subunit 6 n=1 Tax=Thyasira tokunagai TaxID=3055801 RepID=UPI0030FE0272
MLECFFFFFFFWMFFAQHPFSLGAIMLLMSILLGGLISSLMGSWYGFILFLIFVGGLLVLFAYTCALTPMFMGYKKSHKNVGGVFLSFLLIIIYFLVLSGFGTEFLDGLGFGSGVSMSWGVLVTSFVWDVSIVWLVSVLFLAMILVAHICKKQGFPLRAFSKK